MKKKIDGYAYMPPKVFSGEFWWASIGLNVGHEIDGKSQMFSRPVLILKRINNKTFLVIPGTSSEKKGYLFKKITFANGKVGYFCLDQIRIINYKRLTEKCCEEIINVKDFDDIKNRIQSYFIKNNSVQTFSPQLLAEESEVDTAPRITNSIADQSLLSNLNFVRIDKSNYLEYLDQLVKLDEEFNQIYIDNQYATALTRKVNSEIDFKKNIIEEINSDEEYFYEIAIDVRRQTIDIASDKVIGYVLCFLKDKSNFYIEEKVGFIDGIYINEEYRGLGLGKLLISHAEEFFKSKNVYTISLSSKIKNTKAIKLYKELGFVEQDVTMFKKLNI